MRKARATSSERPTLVSQMRINEARTSESTALLLATCGGGGISPTFGAGLWVMDYVLQGALTGVDRLYFHQGTIGDCVSTFYDLRYVHSNNIEISRHTASGETPVSSRRTTAQCSSPNSSAPLLRHI